VGDKAEWLRIGVGGIVPLHLDPAVAKDDSATGTLTGWASVYNVVDQQDDIVMHGAFAKTIELWKSKGRTIALTNGHDNSPTGVIGSAASLAETPYGLKMVASYASTPDAQVIRAKVKEKHVGGLSIYGPIVKKSYETRDGREIQVIHEAGLWAVGVTPMPANEKSLITAAKSLEEEDPLSDVWICDMKSALAITSKTVRRIAVDLLVKSAYPTLGTPPVAIDQATPSIVAVKANALDEASVYALGIIGESEPATTALGGEPKDSLADLLALEQVATTSELDAMLRDFGQSAKG
jgi:HK97 family phage prohead protease